MRAYFLQTERIGFSLWKGEDLPLAQRLWGDGQVTRYISATGGFTGEQIAARLQTEMDNLARFGVQYWPVFLIPQEEFIGCCGLRPTPEDGVYELGFHLRSAYWGRGLGTEAARAAIDYAFGALHAKDLFAGHNPANLASEKVLKKLGFHYVRDEFYPPTGLYHPSYRYRAENAREL